MNEDTIRYTDDGRGMLRTDAGLRVLHLSGGPEDMARQHGELLGPEIRAGALPFMAGFLPAQIPVSRKLWERTAARVQGTVLDQLCVTVARNAPPQMRRAFHALARAAGLSRRTADIAVGTADVLLTLVAWVNRLQRVAPPSWRADLGAEFAGLRARRATPRLPFPPEGGRRGGFGCSGAIALPEHTASGHLLHGRNMDYDGLGYIDRAPAVAFCRPDEGQPYAWIAAAGIHTSALTALNASGLMLGSNTAPTHDVSVRGMPFFALNEQAVREATTLGEAVDRLRRAGAASGYNVHLSHGPSGEAAVVEYSYSRAAVRLPEAGCLVTTNHYLHPEMQESTPPIPLLDRSNSERRYARLEALLRAYRGTLTVGGLVCCLRDTIQPDLSPPGAAHPETTQPDLSPPQAVSPGATLAGSGQRRPLGDVVCNYLNLTSVVADVTDKRFWASAGPAPAALGPYVEFDLERELDAFGQPRSYPLRTLPPAAAGGTPELAAIHAYQQAHASLAYHHDAATAAERLSEAARHAPGEPRIILARALVAVQRGRLQEASRLARAYLASTPSGARRSPRRYRAHLVRGWCADLQGRRRTAQYHYGCARDESPGTADAEHEIRTWQRRPFRSRDQRRLHLDLFNTRRVGI